MKRSTKRLFSLLLTVVMLLACVPAAQADSPADDGVMREGLSAIELTRLMGNGTNLGNTMEACNTNAIAPGNSPLTYEVGWGQPVTTQEMLTAMKAAGFDTIRIPVAWMTNATTLAINGDYIIDPAYLDRVAEIVDYARNAGMYVIINDHWDGGWWGMFGSESAETRQLAMDAYIGMWTQIAVRFADYSDYVIFESANEELQRLRDHLHEPRRVLRPGQPDQPDLRGHHPHDRRQQRAALPADRGLQHQHRPDLR